MEDFEFFLVVAVLTRSGPAMRIWVIWVFFLAAAAAKGKSHNNKDVKESYNNNHDITKFDDYTGNNVDDYAGNNIDDYTSNKFHDSTINSDYTPNHFDHNFSSGPSVVSEPVSANTSWAAGALNAFSRDPHDDGHTFLIKGLDDFRRRLVAELLRNKDNSFRISKANRIVYFDPDDDTWYLHQFLRRNRTALHPGDVLVRVPVTSCVDMSQGAGGHISPNVDVTVSVGHAAAARAGVTNLVAMAAGVSLAHAVSFSGAATCHVAAGHFGQVFLRPFYYEVPRGRRVALRYHRKVGMVERGEWEETESFRRLVVRAPAVECAVGRTRAVCAV